MSGFLKSTFIRNLENGELPDVNVTIDDESLLKLFGGIILVAVIIILIQKIF